VRKAVVALLLLAAGCSSRNGAACPLSVPASGLTVNAGAFVAAHGQARVLRVCASTSAGCAGGVAERLRPRLAASVFVPLMPASRALHLRVVIDAPAGAVLLDKTASFRLRHVADAACPDISSYRASATVSRGGAIGTR
jgi:hypothetical protein